MTTGPVLTALVLAQQPGNGDNGGQGEDFGKSSPLGLLVLILFLIAVALLVRSMTKHLKRVPASFDPESPEGADEPASEQRSVSDEAEDKPAEPEPVPSEAKPPERKET